MQRPSTRIDPAPKQSSSVGIAFMRATVAAPSFFASAMPMATAVLR